MEVKNLLEFLNKTIAVKAGTVLLNLETKQIGIVYRSSKNDYSFPKGHLEKGETLLECAVRETHEETKRDVIVLIDEAICVDEYTDSNGVLCRTDYFLVKDNGHSDNDSLEVHDLVWTDFDKVESLLTYKSLKDMWISIKDIVKKYIEEEK